MREGAYWGSKTKSKAKTLASWLKLCRFDLPDFVHEGFAIWASKRQLEVHPLLFFFHELRLGKLRKRSAAPQVTALSRAVVNNQVGISQDEASPFDSLVEGVCVCKIGAQ